MDERSLSIIVEARIADVQREVARERLAAEARRAQGRTRNAIRLLRWLRAHLPLFPKRSNLNAPVSGQHIELMEGQ